MTDDELRALVREAVARQLGRQGPSAPAVTPRIGGPSHVAAASTAAPSPWQQHPSHHLYVSLVSTGDACVIEPSVTCDHCGYCKSHGH